MASKRPPPDVHNRCLRQKALDLCLRIRTAGQLGRVELFLPLAQESCKGWSSVYEFCSFSTVLLHCDRNVRSRMHQLLLFRLPRTSAKGTECYSLKIRKSVAWLRGCSQVRSPLAASACCWTRSSDCSSSAFGRKWEGAGCLLPSFGDGTVAQAAPLALGGRGSEARGAFSAERPERWELLPDTRSHGHAPPPLFFLGLPGLWQQLWVACGGQPDRHFHASLVGKRHMPNDTTLHDSTKFASFDAIACACSGNIPKAMRACSFCIESLFLFLSYSCPSFSSRPSGYSEMSEAVRNASSTCRSGCGSLL